MPRIDVLALVIALVTAVAGIALIRDVSRNGSPSLSLTAATAVLLCMNLAMLWLTLHR